MDPKEKKVKEEEMNVEDILNNGAEDQPQNEQAEGAAPLTQEEELAQELEKAQETIEEQKDKYLRLSAEFDNYRKRTIKEKAELILNGGEKSLSSILPVVDDFERAIKTMETATDVNAVKEGVELIYNKFLAVLAQNGVKVIETKDQPLDTDYHEAIAVIPAITMIKTNPKTTFFLFILSPLISYVLAAILVYIKMAALRLRHNIIQH